MNSSLEFLQYLQNKKKQLNQEYKQVKVDLQEIEHRIQTPSVKIQKDRIKITQAEFICLVKSAKTKLIKQPSLLKIEGPVFISTGTYGSYHELSLIFEKCGNPKFVNYLFLGNYTGKYQRGIQCLVALLTYKVKFNLNFFLLRGTLETIQYSKASTLYSEIIEYFGSAKAWIQVCELFCCLPFAATINQKIFCVHGGVNPYLFTFQQINQITRPFNTPEKGLPHDLIFANLSYENKTSQTHEKGSYFGQLQTESFMKRTGIKLICRSKSIAEKGFEFVFNKKVINLCSISNYCTLYSNSSAVMMVDDQFNVMFKQISSSMSTKNDQNQEGLTFQQIVQRRQDRKHRLDQLQRIESQKQVNEIALKESQQLQKLKKEQKRKQKQQKSNIRKLKRQMLQQKQEMQQQIKPQQAEQESIE